MRNLTFFQLLAIVFAMLSPAIIFNYFGTSPLYKVYGQKIQEISLNPIGYKELFTEVFDHALECPKIASSKCREEIQRQIMSTLQTTDLNFPEYFVRLTSEGTLQKLFLSGEVLEISANTQGEKRVVSLLLDKEHNLLWNGWRVSESESNIKFLNDLYSEAEVIIPVKVHGKIKGAIVYLYGD